MNFKGTNENWRVNSAYKKEVNSDKGVAIADCSQSKMIDDAEKEANAKLIAASPDLLKACNFALQGIKNGQVDELTVKILEDAISKAMS